MVWWIVNEYHRTRSGGGVQGSPGWNVGAETHGMYQGQRLSTSMPGATRIWDADNWERYWEDKASLSLCSEQHLPSIFLWRQSHWTSQGDFCVPTSMLSGQHDNPNIADKTIYGPFQLPRPKDTVQRKCLGSKKLFTQRHRKEQLGEDFTLACREERKALPQWRSEFLKKDRTDFCRCILVLSRGCAWIPPIRLEFSHRGWWQSSAVTLNISSLIHYLKSLSGWPSNPWWSAVSGPLICSQGARPPIGLESLHLNPHCSHLPKAQALALSSVTSRTMFSRSRKLQDTQDRVPLNTPMSTPSSTSTWMCLSLNSLQCAVLVEWVWPNVIIIWRETLSLLEKSRKWKQVGWQLLLRGRTHLYFSRAGGWAPLPISLDSSPCSLETNVPILAF